MKLVNLDVVKTLFVSFARLSKDQGKSLSPLQVEYITVLLKLAPKGMKYLGSTASLCYLHMLFQIMLFLQVYWGNKLLIAVQLND